MHLKNLSSQPQRKSEFDLLESQWQELGNLTDQLHEQVQTINEERQQRAQAEQQAQAVQNGSDPEIALKTARVASDIQLRQKKVDSTIALSEQKARQKLGQNAVFMRQKMLLSDAKTASDIRLKKMMVDNMPTKE